MHLTSSRTQTKPKDYRAYLLGGEKKAERYTQKRQRLPKPDSLVVEKTQNTKKNICKGYGGGKKIMDRGKKRQALKKRS